MIGFYRQLFLPGLILIGTGCSQQEYGQCASPDEELKVLFKPKSSTNIFSHAFCVVCNTEITPAEYSDWAIQMGAPQGPSDVDDVHPCLFAYLPDDSSASEISSLAQCESLVCEGKASYNDMVRKDNGNVNVSSILE